MVVNYHSKSEIFSLHSAGGEKRTDVTFLNLINLLFNIFNCHSLLAGKSLKRFTCRYSHKSFSYLKSIKSASGDAHEILIYTNFQN